MMPLPKLRAAAKDAKPSSAVDAVLLEGMPKANEVHALGLIRPYIPPDKDRAASSDDAGIRYCVKLA